MIFLHTVVFNLSYEMKMYVEFENILTYISKKNCFHEN